MVSNRRNRQGGSDSGQQFARIEWFDKVVIGSCRDPFDAVVHVRSCGKHQNRAVKTFFAQDPANLEAAPPRKQHVENDQIEFLMTGRLQGSFAIRANGDVMRVASQQSVTANWTSESSSTNRIFDVTSVPRPPEAAP